MSTFIAARRMAPCACVAAFAVAHRHACASAEDRVRPVATTIDAPSGGDAFDFPSGHIQTLLRTRAHPDDRFPHSIHNAFPKP
ncbi:hypothetical protein [Burkholderia anthina]|uniref:hypothetical protein n=1 Tax=Burkholderia anthina TaxID=179879 RepID=UPI00158A43B2|nr:hypothetical protein [Burkholderia anthina]